MFPLLNKHLYIGQSVDGYQVVTLNSNYTGGLMISPVINPLVTYKRNYTETVDTLNTYNSGGSVQTSSGTVTTSFTDWRIPTKAEWETMIGYGQINLLPSSQVVWTSTNGVLDPSNNKFTVEHPSSYVIVEQNKVNEYAVRFVRNFTIR